MPAANDVAGLADLVLEAGDGARSIPPLTDTHDLPLEVAYRVSAEVARRRVARGEPIVGWKIGFTNTTIWDEYGVHAPIWGPVYASTLVASDRPGTPVDCVLAGLVEPRIEPEIVLRFARRPDPRMDEGSLLDCIDAVAHGFEIVQSLFPDWRFRAADTVAAFGLHGRLYRGPLAEIAGDRGRWREALGGFTLALARDGSPVDTGRAANVLGGPLRACLHFVRGLAQDGAFARGIEPGDIVTTGTVTRAWPIAGGETWSSRLDGIDLPGLTLVACTGGGAGPRERPGLGEAA